MKAHIRLFVSGRANVRLVNLFVCAMCREFVAYTSISMGWPIIATEAFIYWCVRSCNIYLLLFINGTSFLCEM